MAEANGMSIINSHIEKGEFSKLYLLGGAEEYLVNQYKNKLRAALIDAEDSMNYGVFKGDGIKSDAIAELATTMPFFADRRVILVEDSDFFKKGNEDMEKLFEDIPDTTVLIFAEHNIDKRCKLYKDISKIGTVANFDTPDERTLLIWVKKLFTSEDIQIEDKAVYKLIEYVGNDMNTLCNEAEKLKCYCMEDGIVTVDKVEDLSVNQIEGKIFDMMDALSRKDKKRTMELYADLKELREPAMRILYLITRQFNLLLKTKLALMDKLDNAKIASALKIQPFVVKKYVAQCNAYTYEELLEKVNMCQEADTSIKTGAMKDNLAVEMLMMNLLQ